jgi:hypothetical protein
MALAAISPSAATRCFAQRLPAQPPPNGREDDAAGEAAALARDLKAITGARGPHGQQDEGKATYALGRLSKLGEPGVEPLADVAGDPTWGPTAVYDLAAMLAGGDYNVPVGGVRRPTSVSALGRPALAALGKVVPVIKARAMKANDPEEDRGPTVALLSAIAGRVPVAATALVDLAAADRVRSAERGPVAAALMNADAATRKRLDAAASARGAGESIKAIAALAALWSRAPADAAREILAMTPEARASAAQCAPADDKVAVPVLVELLADASLTDGLLRQRGKAAFPALRVALKHRDPVVRTRAALLLPDDEAPGAADVLAAAAADPAIPKPVGDGAREALTRIGDAGLEAMVRQLKSDDAAARGAAARVIGRFAPRFDTEHRTSDAARGKAAEALVPLFNDADADTRVAAATSLGALGAAGSPAAAALLKSLPPVGRRQLARTLADAAVSNGLFSFVPPARFGWGAMGDAAAEAFAALRTHPEAAVRDAADQLLLDRDLLVDAREYARRPATTQPIRDEETAAIAKAAAPGLDFLQRDQAMLALDTSRPAVAAALAPLLDSGDPTVRSVAARRLIVYDALLRSPATAVRVIGLWVNDPEWTVRASVRSGLATWFQDRSQQGAPDLHLHAMARAADEGQRWAVAALIATLEQGAIGLNDRVRAVCIEDLRRLAADRSPKVRAMASRAAATLVKFGRDDAASPIVTLVAQALESPDPALRTPAIDAVYFLPPERVRTLADHADPQVRVAALLTIEWPPDAAPPAANQRVPVDVARLALASPSRQIRKIAAQSLLYTDNGPGAATMPRFAKSMQALLDAANDPRGEVSGDALRALVPFFFHDYLVPDPATVRFIYTSRGGGMPKNLPTPWPVVISNMAAKALHGPPADRAKMIAQINAGGPRSVAGRWDLFQHLLDDPDPSLRGLAFSGARAIIFKAMADRYKLTPAPGGLGVPPAAAAPAPSQAR